MFEHWLGLKPWDLERMTTSQVRARLEWLKDQQRQLKSDAEVIEHG